MSDEPIDLDAARLSKALTGSPTAVKVAELPADDVIWKTAPLVAVYGACKAVANLGLEMPTDWPCQMLPGDPMFELYEAAGHLRNAHARLLKVAEKYETDAREGAQQVARLSATWAPQIEALMRAIHVSTELAYKRAKSEHSAWAEREFRRGQP